MPVTRDSRRRIWTAEWFAAKNFNHEKKFFSECRRGYGSGENDYVPPDDRGFVSDGDSVWRHIKDGSTAAGRASK